MGSPEHLYVEEKIEDNVFHYFEFENINLNILSNIIARRGSNTILLGHSNTMI